MQTVKWIFLLVVVSIVPSFSALGQNNDLPFQHTACANGVDLTGQTVTFYNLIDPTNEAVYYPVQAGYSDAAEYFNAHGGICGATVVPEYDDPWMGVLPAYLHITAKTPKPLLVTIYGSGDGEDMLNYLAHDEIPALNVRAGSSASVYGPDGQTLGWEFLTNPLYVDQLGAMCDYIAANPERFPKPVIGFLNIDDDYAKVSAAQGRGYCESLGIGYAGTSTFSGGSTYVHAQIQRLIDAGANIIYTTSDDTGPAAVAQSLSEMDLKDKVALLGVNRVMDSLPALTGEKDLDADGVPVISSMIGSASARSFAEQDNPGIQLITEQADLHQRPATMHNTDYVIGWDTADLFIEVYIQTGNRVGFDHITGADIKETLENIVYTPLSGVERIDYQGGTRRALAENRIGELNYLGQDGKTAASATNPPMVVKDGDEQHLVQMIVPVTDYMTAPDLRPGGADVPVSIPATPEATVTPSSTEAVGTSATPSVAGAGMGEIAFYSDQTGDGDIYVMNMDGSNLVNLTHNPAGDYIPVWSPDGKQLLFNSDRAGNSQIYVIDVASGQTTNLSNNASNDFFASWSPDGKQITFVSDRSGQAFIYVMNADGSDQRQLTDIEGEFPAWSPDGTQIVFGTNEPGEIYRINVDGTGLTDLTNDPSDDGLPSWSPDGKRIAFTSNRDGSEEIFLMNPDGGNLVQLTHSDRPVYNHKSAWSPDGTQIVFVSTRDGNAELYLMNADGSDQTRLTNTPYEEEVPSWRPQSRGNQAEATVTPSSTESAVTPPVASASAQTGRIV
ncbi:MAG: ABC transporter substrate-binding protein, partial [Chloroflexota bacterium]